MRLFLFDLSYIQKLDTKNSIYIELLLRIDMHRTELINHLRVILRIHEIDEQENNFLYWELKSILEECQ